VLPILPPDATLDGSKQCPIGAAAGCGAGRRCPMSPRTYEAGAMLSAEGSAAERLWYVQHGTVALFRENGDQRGAGVPWTVRRPGHLVGEECLVQEGYTDTAVALTQVTLCVASRDSFNRWIDNVGVVASRAVMALVITARCTDAPRPTSAEGSAVSRVARWLADESRDGRAPEMPRGVVAGLLGMLPETFSRALSRLTAMGAIKTTRREIRVVDADVLMAVATE
jgi:CRP-like cAMP-binding protein